MKDNTISRGDTTFGGGITAALLIILLVLSIVFNIAFVTGCVSSDDFRGGSKESTQTRPIQSDPIDSGSSYLNDIATSLGLPTVSDQSPGLIAQNIKQAFNNTLSYKGDIFSDNTFEECKAAIPTAKDTETFEAYHAFIKKIAGKKVLVLDN